MTYIWAKNRHLIWRKSEKQQQPSPPPKKKNKKNKKKKTKKTKNKKQKQNKKQQQQQQQQKKNKIKNKQQQKLIFCIFDNFLHLASIVHSWIPKRYLYVIVLDKIYILCQYLFGFRMCSIHTSQVY